MAAVWKKFQTAVIFFVRCCCFVVRGFKRFIPPGFWELPLRAGIC